MLKMIDVCCGAYLLRYATAVVVVYCGVLEEKQVQWVIFARWISQTFSAMALTQCTLTCT